MEFIPLEKKYKRSSPIKTSNEVSPKKFKQNETSYVDRDVSVRKSKGKPQRKPVPVKNVRNKFRETLAEKRKKKIPRAAKKKVTGKEVSGEGEADEDEGEEEEEEEEVNESRSEANEDEAFKEKCKKMDEKKKNRLFVKMKKKIYSEAQIKELHPDIRGVIFPRKKRSRWCWAVFASEEKAGKAFEKLKANPDVLVTKPTPYEMVERKREQKMKVIQRKKEIKKKLKQMWR